MSWPGDGKIPRDVKLRGREILRRLAAVQGPVRVAEVGVYTGYLSRFLLSRRRNLTLIMVDLWETGMEVYRRSGAEHSRLSIGEMTAVHELAKANVEFAGKRAILIQGDSALSAAQVANESLDLAFLDADHTFEAVLRDDTAWWPKVKPGGWIGGHDWKHPELHIRKPGEPKKWGVEKAVRTFFPGQVIQEGKNRTWFFQKALAT